jgi:hypothetical protein
MVHNYINKFLAYGRLRKRIAKAVYKPFSHETVQAEWLSSLRLAPGGKCEQDGNPPGDEQGETTPNRGAENLDRRTDIIHI